ncbi:MAG: type VI secretion system tip protein VgrG [Candidatus Sulfotelmatobacter sp.]
MAQAVGFSQDNRLISIDTPLGKDVLLLSGFNGSEGISRLFRFDLELFSEQNSINFKDIIGQNVTIHITLTDGSSDRIVSGFVSRFAQSGSDRQFTHYQMEVVPWLWFLTRIADCRIFQNMTIPDIIKKVFQSRNFSDFKMSLTGSYDTRKYCVQYRETDFNFVSRLMEQYGIFYFFEHKDGKHTLVLADSASAHSSLDTGGAMTYDVGGVDDYKVITSWQTEQQLHSGKYTTSDYSFTTPASNLKKSETTVFDAGDNSKYEIYDYPGEYFDATVGEALAKVRMEEEEASHLVARGSGFCPVFSSGYKFDLKDHPRSDMNGSYVLTEVTHTGSAGYGNDSGSSHYSNHFTCIPATSDEKPIKFRPARVTPKPFVQGPQTALVVGKSGEEIWIDKYGRIKVQFYWDRVGNQDENSSCWIRVSQPWAGNGWGSIWTPRIGQEVVVSFVEGDPDRPIVTGRVYNAQQLVPYTLPDHQTVSTFMGNSSKGGGANPNELRFEDKHGDEQLFINAQKDLDMQVINDLREHIKANRSLIVEQDQKDQVNGKYSLTVQSGTEVADSTSIHLKAPKIVLEADTMVSLVVGGNFVTIDSSGVAVTGTMVMLNSGGSAGSGGSPATPDKADDGTKFTKQ